jgi:Putative motility protein
MDVSATASSSASQATGAEYSNKVMRKALDIQASQGAQLAQMVAQAGGVGQNVDMKA